jgi:hypothetical protein
MAGLEYIPGREVNRQSYQLFEIATWSNVFHQFNRWRGLTLKLPVRKSLECC